MHNNPLGDIYSANNLCFLFMIKLPSKSLLLNQHFMSDIQIIDLPVFNDIVISKSYY